MKKWLKYVVVALFVLVVVFTIVTSNPLFAILFLFVFITLFLIKETKNMSIGIKTLILTSIFPLFIIFFSIITGEFTTLADLSFGITTLLVFILPLTITNIIGKKIINSKNPTLVFLMPLLAAFFASIILVLGILMADILETGYGGVGLVFYIPFVFCFNLIASIIVSIILYRKK